MDGKKRHAKLVIKRDKRNGKEAGGGGGVWRITPSLV